MSRMVEEHKTGDETQDLSNEDQPKKKKKAKKAIETVADEPTTHRLVLHFDSFVSMNINGKLYEGTSIEVEPNMVESVKAHIFHHYGLIAK